MAPNILHLSVNQKSTGDFTFLSCANSMDVLATAQHVQLEFFVSFHFVGVTI